MFIHEIHSKGKNGKIYVSTLVRINKRVGKKVVSKTLTNLTKLPKHIILAVKRAIENGHKSSLCELADNNEFVLRKKESVGALFVVSQIAKRLGITQSLGVTFHAQLLLWQVIARVLRPATSLLAMVRLASSCAAAAILGWRESFTEDHLYDNGAWIQKRQPIIEKRLWHHGTHEKSGTLFLYDVTSSYLEGTCNELGAFGYNRDGKRGKMQVVVGMLTDEKGDPCSIQVYRGNTQDPKTFADQIHKVKDIFGCEQVAFVGDRGMIKSDQIQEAKQAHFHYITALTKPQIEKLLKSDVIQMELFDEALGEAMGEDGTRYVLRRNPVRKQEILDSRLSKKKYIEEMVATCNQYLSEHSRAKSETQYKKVLAKIKQLGVQKWLQSKIEEDRLVLVEDKDALAKESTLDGCYVIFTDLTASQASKEVVHSRYKSLAQVEQDFRNMKQGHLEFRPWYVVKEENTHAHAFSSMLALKIRRALAQAWSSFDITVEEGLRLLEGICVVELVEKKSDQVIARYIPELPSDSLEKNLLDALQLEFPNEVPSAKVTVGTRVKISDRRKQR